MKLPLPKEELEKAIGYTFRKPEILNTALTHSSYSNENKSRKSSMACNERLEFLGDSVLSLLVSEYLYERFDNRPEGELTKVRAAVVCGSSLSDLSRSIGLGNYLMLGKGEEQNRGRESKSILENAFEALLAAIYLDSGCDKATVAKFLMPLVIPEIEDAAKEKVTSDYKTELQQFVQQSGSGEVLEYDLTGETGPDHCKVFYVDAVLNHNVIGRGTGHSKREAEQRAAKEGLLLFGIRPENKE